jgi:myo-inositol-1(or 4)-monophosphatase
MNPTPRELVIVCEQAARAGAEQLLAWKGRFQARQKAPRDLVTDADLASEKAVRAVIAAHFPEHGILGEEAPTPDELDRPYCWVVDPLDGTINYAHGNPCYGVSIAVASRGRLLAGVVYDPERDECFAAAAGELPHDSRGQLRRRPGLFERRASVPGRAADWLGGPQSGVCRLWAVRRPLGV